MLKASFYVHDRPELAFAIKFSLRFQTMAFASRNNMCEWLLTQRPCFVVFQTLCSSYVRELIKFSSARFVMFRIKTWLKFRVNSSKTYINALTKNLYIFFTSLLGCFSNELPCFFFSLFCVYYCFIALNFFYNPLNRCCSTK